MIPAITEIMHLSNTFHVSAPFQCKVHNGGECQPQLVSSRKISTSCWMRVVCKRWTGVIFVLQIPPQEKVTRGQIRWPGRPFDSKIQSNYSVPKSSRRRFLTAMSLWAGAPSCAHHRCRKTPFSCCSKSNLNIAAEHLGWSSAGRLDHSQNGPIITPLPFYRFIPNCHKWIFAYHFQNNGAWWCMIGGMLSMYHWKAYCSYFMANSLL
jgi:hypothetical protein